jgi:uncharacterized protein DUF4012
MRRLAVAAGILVGGALLVCLLVLPSALSVRRDLNDGRDALAAGRQALNDGQLSVAIGRFEAARASFARASSTASSGGLGLISKVPFAGRTVDTALALGEGGGLVADAGSIVLHAVSDDGGLGTLAAVEGRIPLERIPPLAAAVDRAAPMLERAQAIVNATPTSFVIGAVARARDEAKDEFADAGRSVDAARSILARLPSFLGADGPMTYFVGAEDPAELRGTGGLIGAYAILTIDDGRLSLSAFRPIQTLPVLPLSKVTPPSSQYATLYDADRRGSGFWKNVNLTPDFPSAAVALENSYEAATGRHLDGVITADPFALRSLVQATGPARVPELGRTLVPGDVVPFLSSEGFEAVPNPVERKQILGDVAEAVLTRALASADTDVVRHLSGAAADGHVKVYSDDPQMERGLALTGAGGAFGASTGDFFSVITNNAAADKLDYYVSRDVTYEVWLGPDGSSRVSASVQLANDAPDTPLPSRVLGEGPSLGLSPGETRSLVNVYCVRCALAPPPSGAPQSHLTGGDELGTTFFQRTLTIPPGSERSLSLNWAASNVWTGDGSGGEYDLAIDGQTTIQPSNLRVVIHLPDGMRPTSLDDGMRIEDDAVVWNGDPLGRVKLRVRFRAPFLLGVWRDLTARLG